MSLSGNFNTQRPDHIPPPLPKRRPAPFCLRLTDAERARLTAEAKGAPLGAYIKAKALGAPLKATRRSGLTVEDRQALAKALALLGSSRFSSNLNQLAHAANIGALSITPELEADLAAAVEDIRAIRALLMTALGLKPEARS